MRKYAAAFAMVLTTLVSVSGIGQEITDKGTIALANGDHETVLAIYLPRAKEGDADAEEMMGYLYRKGMGVPQDYAEAMKWMRLAANKGQAGAQTHLGEMLEAGQGARKDYVEAHMWCNLAAARVQKGFVSLGEPSQPSVICRDRLAEKMSDSQIAEAQKRARAWQAKKMGER